MKESLPEKPVVHYLVDKFPALFEPRKFISMFIRAHHLTLS
jgi:hypothetical protein